ncbi:MAG TPA: ion channel [Thermoanaerobaculia bacterium]|nr:ion channel [Thermoanaerobaculia bacterium]
MAVTDLKTLSEDANRDLGFGAVVARESRQRLLNRDGSFNVVREGLNPFTSLSLYHYLLTTTWPRFLGLVVVLYLLFNASFAAAYMACGPGAIAGATASTPGDRYLEAFFFSIQTFATIGYGVMSPHSLAAHVLVTVESLIGLLGFALATGLLFARFSRPVAMVQFSDIAVIAPYQGITAFEFRLANARSNELIQVEARVLLSRFKPGGGGREFLPLKLERHRVDFFPLSWTVVHPIDDTSPLYGLGPEDLEDHQAEFLILLTAFDETFSQTVHTRSSYEADEVVWGATFVSVFKPERDDRKLSIDVGRLSEIRRVVRELP